MGDARVNPPLWPGITSLQSKAWSLPTFAQVPRGVIFCQPFPQPRDFQFSQGLIRGGGGVPCPPGTAFQGGGRGLAHSLKIIRNGFVICQSASRFFKSNLGSKLGCASLSSGLTLYT
ncbi:UNVERIFIED_CONTAM: hypothetical protein K2H54_059524 [Gekko kuhli]